MTLDEFKDIIRKLYNIGENDLPNRVNKFKECDSNNVGVVYHNDIIYMYHDAIQAKYKLTVLECAEYVKNIMEIYGNKNFLNFFEFTNFVKEIIETD